MGHTIIWQIKELPIIEHIMVLWVMIIFFVWAWASLLLNKKPDEAKKHLYSLLYIMLWWVLVYGSNWLFWEVFNFNWSDFTTGQTWLEWFTETLIGKVAFRIFGLKSSHK